MLVKRRSVVCWGEEGGVWCAGVKMEGVMCWSEEGGV